MQVLNYQFHEQLSKNYHYNLDKYSEYEKQKIEERYNSGDTSEEVIEYIYILKEIPKCTWIDKTILVTTNLND